MEIRASTDHREAPTMYTAPTTALLGSAATIAVTHPAYDHLLKRMGGLTALQMHQKMWIRYARKNQAYVKARSLMAAV